jgi:DnaK suppressor protein
MRRPGRAVRVRVTDALTPAELAAAAGLLAAERACAADTVDALGRDLAGIIAAATSTTADDEHDPEGATIAFERAQAAALLDQSRRHVADLDAAIERLRAGGYGRCEGCGQPIPAERLAARPQARTCLDCAPRRR